MFNKTRLLCVIAASALLLSACGGGGGGGSSTPNPPTGGTPTNAAPVASITASDTAPGEGKTSSLDGSGSSDADGDSLTYSWTQLSGPAVSFSAQSGAVTDIAVPNLTADSAARIQLSVSDGTTSTTAEVTLTLTNLVLTPAANTTIISEKTVSYPNRVLGIPTSFNFFESLNYLVYESGGRVLLDLFGYDVDGNANAYVYRPEAIEANASDISSAGTPAPFGISWLAAYGESQVTFYEPLSEPAERVTIDVDQPCNLISEPGFSPGNVIIGSRGGESVIVEFTLDENSEPNGTIELDTFAEGAALCEMQIVRRSRDYLLAFDQSKNEIRNFDLLQDDDGHNTAVIFHSTVLVDLKLAAGETAEFVASHKIDSAGEKGIALVFSNGETEGVHRLVIVSLEADGAILQATYSWAYGSPASISSISVDDHGGDTLFITTSDSPYAVTFKSGGFFAGETSYLPLSEPAYFDLGVGHELVAPLSGGSPRKTGLIATFPDENLIKVFEKE